MTVEEKLYMTFGDKKFRIFNPWGFGVLGFWGFGVAEVRFDEADSGSRSPLPNPEGWTPTAKCQGRPRPLASSGFGTVAAAPLCPGVLARIRVSWGKANDLAGILGFNDSVYVSDNSSGSLVRFADGKVQPIFATNPSQDNTITCAVAFGNRAMLVGTSAHGIRLFDGHTLLPFATTGTLSGAIRINDLCDAGNGTYAAAIENFGVAFFDHSGRVLQTVETTLDG